jgi:hypothetical protein
MMLILSVQLSCFLKHLFDTLDNNRLRRLSNRLGTYQIIRYDGSSPTGGNQCKYSYMFNGELLRYIDRAFAASLPTLGAVRSFRRKRLSTKLHGSTAYETASIQNGENGHPAREKALRDNIEEDSIVSSHGSIAARMDVETLFPNSDVREMDLNSRTGEGSPIHASLCNSDVRWHVCLPEPLYLIASILQTLMNIRLSHVRTSRSKMFRRLDKSNQALVRTHALRLNPRTFQIRSMYVLPLIGDWGLGSG